MLVCHLGIGIPSDLFGFCAVFHLDVYQKKGVVTSGPLPTKHEINGNKVIVSFTHTVGGLKAKGGKLKGFVIAGADYQWKQAEAKIEREYVIVSHPEIAKPIAVRYTWEANPDGNLYNKAGLPASPYRTDDAVVQPATGFK